MNYSFKNANFKTNFSNRDKAKKPKIKTTIKYGSSSLAFLSLAACGGGGEAPTNPTPTPTPTPPPAPTAGFTLVGTNTFLANNDLNSTFSRTTSSTDYTVSGRNGNDNIATGSGDDILFGEGGNDSLNGGTGNDGLIGGAGADQLNGGSGFDFISYAESPSGVTVNLTSGTGSGGHAAGDSIIGVEGVFGSNNNDNIIGNSDDNIFEGLGGADSFTGGGGFDLVAYISSNNAVTVNLDTGTGSDGDANGDTYTDIDGVLGSNLNDVLTGDGNDNYFEGVNGGDTINGGGGDDTIYGNDGIDDLFGGDGDDFLDGGEGNDNLFGQNGNDLLLASAGSDDFDGGNGIDRLSFFNSPSGINIDLAAGTSSGGYATSISFTNIENIWGSNFGDNITGDDGDNSLGGLDGVDNLNGGAGNDWFRVFEFEGSATEDAFDGGVGFDKFDFESDSLSVAYNVDLATVDAINIELVRMGHDYVESLTLTAQDVIDVTDADNILNVIVHAEDTVTSGSTWTYVEDVMTVGQIYHQYTSGAATVNIYLEAGTQNGFAKPADSFTETTANVFDAVDNSNSSISKEHVSEDLTINGKDGNDLMAGGAGDDVINGGNGNDSMRGNSGVNTLNGDAGDDLLIYSNSDSTYNGGADTDTLQLVNQNDEIDLSTLTLTNIEVFDLSSIYSNSTTLTAQDVLDVTDGGNLLIIAGDDNDTVSSTGQAWAAGGTQNVNGQDYDVYTSGAATLYIDEDIVQVIS